MKKPLWIAMLCFFSALSLPAQGNARWIRYPAISPDGKTIVFGYRGNLYRVGGRGGTAVALTTGDAYDMRPVWSHDGKTLAFASDRYGNFDVYTMPSTGGTPVRITYHSAADYPYDFTPDNRKVLFGSGREAPAKSVRFPTPHLFKNLYTIPVRGGRPILLTAAGAEEAHYNATGSKIVFEDRKGYEDPYRKHHTSSVTRDIWLYDIGDNTYRRLSDFKGEDRAPVFASDDRHVYYLSERDGTQNLYKKSLESGSEKQLTAFTDFPVRHLSVSRTNALAFTWKGDLYTITDGDKPKKLRVEVRDDSGFQTEKNVKINTVTEFAVSPNGKELAFVNRGEVFVTGAGSRTKRITDTPEQERMIDWSPDGKTLLFSGERDGSWNIYKVTLTRPEEKYFYASTALHTEPLIATDAEEFQPRYSPDGKKVAFVYERNILKVLNLNTKVKTTVLPQGHNYSNRDGDWGFAWSPDSKWLLVDDERGYDSFENTALIKADGSGEIVYPVNGGFGEYDAKWGMGGKMMTYSTNRNGKRSLAENSRRQSDVYAVFFNRKAYDRYKLSKADFALLKDREKKEKKDKKDAHQADKKSKKKGKRVKRLGFDLKNLNTRKVRLTINSSDISDYALNKDASKLYYLSAFEKGYDLWVTEPRTRKTRILAKLGGSPSGIQISGDGNTLFLINRGRPVRVDTQSGRVKNIDLDGDMVIDAAAERKYIFDHIWRQVTKKIYDPTIHGMDWKMYRDAYAAFLPHIDNNYDFQVLLSETLGELNVSHTGARYYPYRHGTQTASLGLLYDECYTGPGIKVSEVIQGGPLDKAGTEIKAGDIITKIDGKIIKADENPNRYLNNIRGKNTLLTIKSGGLRLEEIVKPVSMRTERKLMYKRWTQIMAEMVDSLSGGQIGYVHVREMDDSSFRAFYENVFGKNRDRKALLVDTRFNGGGNLHDDLNTFLSGKRYLKWAPQGHVLKGGEPSYRWTKPSIVLMNEGNYSDAFLFPYVYRQNGIGKLVGMPVAGTGTAVWWERQIDPTLVFGIPMIATIGKEGRPTENLELEPDILVPLPYAACLNGRDTQLEAAVRELLKALK